MRFAAPERGSESKARAAHCRVGDGDLTLTSQRLAAVPGKGLALLGPTAEVTAPFPASVSPHASLEDAGLGDL